MKHTFYCEPCQQSFRDTGEKLSWQHPIYGASWKLVADCPTCGQEAPELKDQMKSSHHGEQDTPACPTGTCPWAQSS